MQVAGAVFLTYKSLYYELLEAWGLRTCGKDAGGHFGPFPDDFATPRSNELNGGGRCDFQRAADERSAARMSLAIYRAI